MAGQPSAPEDHAATAPGGTPQPRYCVHGPCAAPVSELGAHGEEARSVVSNHEGPYLARGASFETPAFAGSSG